MAHAVNSGRLTDLFTPGCPVWLAPVEAPLRLTGYDLKLVEVVFIVQRSDAGALRAHPAADPEFSDLLSCAARGGVIAKAYSCRVSLQEICVDREIPVKGL